MNRPQNKRYVGINYNAQTLGGSDYDYALQTAININAISYTAMDGHKFAVDLQRALPDSIITHRQWNPVRADEDTHEYRSPGVTAKSYAQLMIKYGTPHIPEHALNEPDIDDVPKLVDFLIELMDLCGKGKPLQQRLVVGNFAVDKSFQLTPDGKSIKFADEWLRFARAFEKHIDWHILGLHSYWLGDYRFALLDGYPTNMMSFEAGQLSNLRYVNEYRILTERLPDGKLPPMYHGYAYIWYFMLCLEAGIQIPYHMFTELWLDEKWDGSSADVMRYVQHNHGVSEYNNGIPRGIWTWQKFDEYVTGKPYIAALSDQLSVMTWQHQDLENRIPQLKGKQLGGHAFQLNKTGWEKPGHSIYAPPIGGEGKHELRRQLHNIMTLIPLFTGDEPDEPTEPQPLPVFTMRRGFLHSTYPTGSNIRAGFNTRTQVVAIIGIDPMTVAFSNETVENDGFKWHKVVITDLVGYIAKTEHIHFEPVEDTPPEPEPPQDDDHVIITKDTAKAIAECYLSIMKANAKLYEIFAELGGVLTVSALDGVVFSDVSATDNEVATTVAIMLDEDDGEAEEPAAA